jgi:hypothetical protein
MTPFYKPSTSKRSLPQLALSSTANQNPSTGIYLHWSPSCARLELVSVGKTFPEPPSASMFDDFGHHKPDLAHRSPKSLFIFNFFFPNLLMKLG